jgi:hypothetical protein
MEEPKNLSVFEVLEGRKVKNDRSAREAAKQTNTLPEHAYSQTPMREFADLGLGIVALDQITRLLPIPRPDTKMNDITCRHRCHLTSRWV